MFCFKIFYPIYQAEELIIPYAIHPFDICSTQPELWNFIKKSYILIFPFSDFIFIKFLYNRFFIKFSFNYFYFFKNFKKEKNINLNNSFKLLIGNNYLDNSSIYLSESGLYQNFLITGTIGSGKTSSAIYPFVNQFIQYNSAHLDDKIGMLILDVKGNFYSYVSNVAKKYNLENDLFVISLYNKVYYNP